MTTAENRLCFRTRRADGVRARLRCHADILLARTEHSGVSASKQVNWLSVGGRLADTKPREFSQGMRVMKEACSLFSSRVSFLLPSANADKGIFHLWWIIGLNATAQSGFVLK